MSALRARSLWPALPAVGPALAWATVPVLLLAYHVVVHGGVLSGSDGPLAGADQLFYMDSVRQSGMHLLIADHFDLVLGRAVFLHPLYLLGGLMWRAGLSLQASFWALQLLGAVAVAVGAAALGARVLPAGRPRMVALTLGLFFLSPLLPLLAWAGAIGAIPRYQLLLVTGEATPGWQLWGYPQAGVAVGALAAALLGAAALAAGRTGARLILAVCAAACLCAWLHPWQGAIFIVVAVALALQTRARAPVSALALAIAAAAAPMLYEAILSRTDAAWHLDSVRNGVGQGPAWALLAGLAPLAIPAVLSLRRVASGPLRTVLVGWPLAAVAVYFGTAQFPYHALEGISIPLAALVVAGWPAQRTATRRWAITAALAAAVALGAVYEISTFRDSERSGAAPYFLTAGERAALRYLDHDPEPGGVLARDYIGMAVPAYTGRRTWVGEWTWTPDFPARAALAERLMAGSLSPAQAQQMVDATGARFVLSDCGARAPLAALLQGMVVSERRFGCAAVLELRPLSRA